MRNAVWLTSWFQPGKTRSTGTNQALPGLLTHRNSAIIDRYLFRPLTCAHLLHSNKKWMLYIIMFFFCVQSAFWAKNIAAENIVFSAICFPGLSETQWSESHSVVSNSSWPHGPYNPWNSPGQNTGVGSRSLLQGIFPTQGLNPGLPHCRWILYYLSHQQSPRTLEWVA